MLHCCNSTVEHAAYIQSHLLLWPTQTIALISVVAAYGIWHTAYRTRHRPYGTRLDSIQVYSRVCTLQSHQPSCKNLSWRDERRETSQDALVRHQQRLSHNEPLPSLWCILSRYMLACRVLGVACRVSERQYMRVEFLCDFIQGDRTFRWHTSLDIRMNSFFSHQNDVIWTWWYNERHHSWLYNERHHSWWYNERHLSWLYNERHHSDIPRWHSDIPRCRCQNDVFHCIISLRSVMMHWISHESCHSDMRKTSDWYPCPIHHTVLTTT